MRLRKRALDLGLYGHLDYAPFLVLGRSRVGSNLLRSLLNAHGQIAAYGEVFRDSSCLDWDHTGYFQSRAMRVLVQRDPVQFVNARVFGRYPTSVRAVGFKLFYYHARDGAAASVWPYLQDRKDVKIIHVRRRNVLQTHLSRKRAALTERWVDTVGRPEAAPAVRLDYQECLGDFIQTRAWEQEADRFFAGHSKLEIEYEELARNYRVQAHSLQDFLKVPRCAVEPSTFRQSGAPLSTMIANYGELKEKFAGTTWAEFFTD